MTAEQLLTAVEQAYAKHQTYADTGSVTTVFSSANGSMDFTSTITFKTAFIRPDRFRFEFSSHFPHSTDLHRSIIAAHGPSVQTWWDLQPGIEQKESLTMAIAGATGVSKGSALKIPSLLAPDWASEWRITERAVLTRLEDEELDGVMFHRVARQQIIEPMGPEEEQKLLRVLGHIPPGMGAPREPDIFWIEQKSLLIRRIDGTHTHATFQTKSVTLYKPMVNGEVTEAQLAFDPPAMPTPKYD